MKKLFIVLSVSIVLIFTVKIFAPENPGNNSIKSQISYLPKASVVKIMALGHTNSLSSLYWISAIINLGDSFLTGVKFKWFNQVANLVTTLDPQWKIVYEFTGGVADTNDSAVDSVMVRGIHQFSNDWRLSVYYAMYLVNEKKNYAMASEIMKPFETRRDIPEHITRMSKSFALETMPRETALMISLEDYYNPLNRGFVKAIARRMLQLLQVAKNPSETEISKARRFLDQLHQGTKNPSEIYGEIYKDPLVLLH